MDSIQQFSRSDSSSESKHFFEASYQYSHHTTFSDSIANVVSAMKSVTGMSLSGVLPLETLTTGSNECPMECLTTLTAYTDKQQGKSLFVFLSRNLEAQSAFEAC